MIDFEGQAAVVTGAGRGLGRLYALELARRGARVVVNDVGTSMGGAGADRAVADAVVDEITTAGGTAVASHDSVDSPEGGAAIVAVAIDTFGRLDAVVSNAGIYEMTPFEDLTTDQWRRMRSVHLDGAFHLAQPAYRQMLEQGSGRIVFVASNIAAFGQEHAVHYGAAKGGIIGLTHALANEGAPHGIKVNAVLPVGRTRMMLDSMGQGGGDRSPVVDQLFDACSPEKVVGLVTFLASSACEVSHQLVSAVAGRYGRIFLGLGDGWLGEGEATAEDVAEHLDEILATEPHTVPMSVADEIVTMLQRLELI